MIIQGESLSILKTLSDESVDCVVTSPPYWGLRDYGVEGQIGLEESPEAFVERLVQVFREVRRVLKSSGTLWMNLGDSYNSYGGNRGASIGTANRRHHEFMPSIPARAGLNCKWLKPKDLIGIPWRVAFALQADGWFLRQDIIWHKPNPMPESVRDRCTKAHEYIFLLSKTDRYFFDADAIKEPCVSLDPSHPSYRGNSAAIAESGVRKVFTGGKHERTARFYSKDGRNKRSVWTVTTKPFKGAHFATFPIDLIEPCILAGAPKGGVVLDPFFGSGTTGAAAIAHDRQFIGIELNPAYVAIAEKRIASAREARTAALEEPIEIQHEFNLGGQDEP